MWTGARGAGVMTNRMPSFRPSIDRSASRGDRPTHPVAGPNWARVSASRDLRCSRGSCASLRNILRLSHNIKDLIKI